jgi:transcriptional regulator with XRE-family HTH domain
MTKTLGQRLRELREKTDLSLREFAGKLDVSPAFVSDVELGRRNPSDKMLAEIARILKTSVDDLKSYDTRPPIDELRRKTSENPAFSLAFRTVLDSNISAEELLKWVQQKQEERDKEKHSKKK